LSATMVALITGSSRSASMARVTVLTTIPRSGRSECSSKSFFGTEVGRIRGFRRNCGRPKGV
jgi:hypothetical protein